MDNATLPLVLVWNSFEEINKSILVCSEWRDIIIGNDSLWKHVLISNLKELKSNGAELNENITVKENETWHSITNEVLFNPFDTSSDGQLRYPSKIEVPNNVETAMRQYDRANGVVDWDFFQVKDSLLRLLTRYNNSVPLFVHELAVILAVASQHETINLYPFIKQMKLPKEERKEWKRVRMNEMEEPYVTDPEDGCILGECGSPPYSMKWPTPDLRETVYKEIEEAFYKQSGWAWIRDFNEMKQWAPYWGAGMEWWGCYCCSHFPPSLKNILVVSRASTSD